jgi:hypothetical protein
MRYKNESQILNLIKCIPSLFIISILIIITVFLYIEKTNSFNTEKVIWKKSIERIVNYRFSKEFKAHTTMHQE